MQSKSKLASLLTPQCPLSPAAVWAAGPQTSGGGERGLLVLCPCPISSPPVLLFLAPPELGEEDESRRERRDAVVTVIVIWR